MSLLTRLVSPLDDEGKLPVHQFMAALAEYKRGAITGAQLIIAFDLSTEEATSLQTFLDNLDGDTVNRALIHDVLMLGEAGYYTINQIKARLQV